MWALHIGKRRQAAALCAPELDTQPHSMWPLHVRKRQPAGCSDVGTRADSTSGIGFAIDGAFAQSVSGSAMQTTDEALRRCLDPRIAHRSLAGAAGCEGAPLHSQTQRAEQPFWRAVVPHLRQAAATLSYRYLFSMQIDRLQMGVGYK